ncbi:TolC family protein [Pseudosulfitobacter pseudonitzschiae]|uniref:TolC family protein n=1 Tax=Pseudosulfitobacter pseudonitzschiae TaxID=1402135 RepID=UPI003B812DBD
MSKRIRATFFSSVTSLHITTCSCLAALLLSACGGGTPGQYIAQGSTVPLKSDARVENSSVISGLQSRHSILEPGTPAKAIASATLASNTGPGSADLRLRRIKADVEAKNWLPRIGPDISLTSMSSLAASLILDVALFDNGRKRAEREYAVADVEVAAVNLSIEANDRVYEALSRYTDLQRSEMEARITRLAITKLEEFDAKAVQRVSSGYSNTTERSEISQSLTEMRSVSSDAEQQAAQARSQLSHMGVTVIPSPSFPLLSLRGHIAETPLDIALAEAKANRGIAEARIERAGSIPGLGASVAASSSGSTASASVSGPGMGYGTGAITAALSASQDLARQNVTHARSQSALKINALQGEISRIEARRGILKSRVTQAREGFELNSAQFITGSRQLTDVVEAFTTMVGAELERSRSGFDLDQAKLDLAREYGVLADGNSI